MAERVLTRMFQKIFDEKFKYYLEIADYFWKHWDELAEKQYLFDWAGRDENGDYQGFSFHEFPEKFLQAKFLAKIQQKDDSLYVLGDFLSDYCKYRRRLGKRRSKYKSRQWMKMTKKFFVKMFFQSFDIFDHSYD